MRLPLALRYWWTRFRLRRLTRPIDRQIAAARRKHRPVRHLLEAKASLIRFGLEGGAR